MSRQEAYTAMLKRHHTMLWRMCWHRADGDRDGCCDLLQEVSIALWKNYDKLRPDTSLSQERAWVRWQARSVFYQSERRRTLPSAPLTDDLTDRTPDERDQYREILDELMTSLDHNERLMMQLYIDGYRGDEISQRMGISRDTYYQRMRRAVKKMKLATLIVLALLVTSTVAVALVPQLRRFVFGGGEIERRSTESMPAPQPDTAGLRQDDTTALSVKPPQPHAEEIMPMERLSLLEMFESMDVTDDNPLFASVQQDSLMVSLDGAVLTITGAEGEMVKLYDMGWHLIVAEQAGAVCIINLFPASHLRFGSYWYHLYVGDRPEILLEI